MNNATMNREQFNEPINKTPFYAIGERLIPFKKITYPISKAAGYQEPKQIPYPVSKMAGYNKGKKIPYPTAKGLIKHRFKRRKLV